MAFICLLYSVSLGLLDIQRRHNIKDIGLQQYLFAIAIRQRRNDIKTIDMLSTSMFIIGIIFLLYIFGLLYMINWANTTKNEDMIADKKTNHSKKKRIF